jgi:solute carrier family 35, member F1/2
MSWISAVIYGQILSLLLSGTFIFTQLVNQAGVYSSIFPNELVYHLLFLIIIFKYNHIYQIFIKQTKGTIALAVGMGLLDVASNVSMLKSFQYTSAVSAVLISSTSAVLAVPMSYFYLKTRYNMYHCLGILVVIIGIVIINFSKMQHDDDQSFDYTGSILAALASFGFAASAVIQTRIIVLLDGDGYPWGALSIFGVVSSIFSALIANTTSYGIQDRDSLLNSTDPHVYYIIGYILSMALFYILAPLYLQRFSAVNFQMSILTADIGVYAFNVLMGRKMSLIYVLGFFTVIGGLAGFNLAGFGDEDVDDVQGGVEAKCDMKSV